MQYHGFKYRYERLVLSILEVNVNGRDQKYRNDMSILYLTLVYTLKRWIYGDEFRILLVPH